MTITASAAQLGGTPVQSGSRTFRAPQNITAASPIGVSVDVSGDTFCISLLNTGTLDNAASLAIHGTINGSSFYQLFYPGTTTPITFTGTQINAGLLATINVKCLQIRGVLTPGSTTGTNGVAMRVLD